MQLHNERKQLAKAIRGLEHFDGKNVNQMGEAAKETIRQVVTNSGFELPQIFIKREGQKQLIDLSHAKERLHVIEETIHKADAIESDPDFEEAVKLAEQYVEISQRLKAAHGYDWERTATRCGLAKRLPTGWEHMPEKR